MKKIKYYIYYLLCAAMFSMSSCSIDEADNKVIGMAEIMIDPILESVSSRLDNADADGSDGRSTFKVNDILVFTKICRTSNPLPVFTYKNHQYIVNAYGGWIGYGDSKNEKIYWTDASDHTFIGYCVPQKSSEEFKFTNVTGTDIYEGTLGTNQSTAQKMQDEDLLITYSDTTEAYVAQDVVSAKIKMSHALSKIKVVLSIDGFAASKDATYDIGVTISNMSINNQPLNYIWDQKSATVSVKSGCDTNNEISLWNAATLGTSVSKTFLSYGLVVPGTRSFDVNMNITYSDADNNYASKTQSYKAHFENIVFTGGKRTTLYISLNHKDENILVNATYSDWKEVSIDNRSELLKENIFLQTTNITDANSPHLASEINDIDLADWLYVDAEGDSATVKDRYGNDGLEATPYLIKTAYEFLAFAKEVANGRTFENKFIKLNSDIYLQPGNTSESLSWTGVGNNAYAFAGTFDGNNAAFLNLKGEPIFYSLDEKAIVKHLTVQTYDARRSSTTGFASSNRAAILCKINNGTIMGCMLYGTVKGIEAAGGIAAINNGRILASFHNGKVSATDMAGGVTGNNTGIIKACYQANGNISASIKGGIAASNDSGGLISYSFYDTTSAPNITAIDGQTDSSDDTGYRGYSINDMQSSSFYNKLNAGISIADSVDVTYIQNPASYPTLTW